MLVFLSIICESETESQSQSCLAGVQGVLSGDGVGEDQHTIASIYDSLFKHCYDGCFKSLVRELSCG